MSTTLDEAVAALNRKLEGGFDGGTARIDIAGEGSIMLDGEGARAGEGPADVTLSADLDTFRGMLDGHVNPTGAFMSGRLSVDGDMGLARTLGAALS